MPHLPVEGHLELEACPDRVGSLTLLHPNVVRPRSFILASLIISVDLRNQPLPGFDQRRLRPKSVNDEREGPAAALLSRGPFVAAFGRGRAKGWRPGQRQHIEVEFSWLVLALVLRTARDRQSS